MKSHKSERWSDVAIRLNCVFIDDFNEWEDRCVDMSYLNCRLFAGFVIVIETTLDTPFRAPCKFMSN